MKNFDSNQSFSRYDYFLGQALNSKLTYAKIINMTILPKLIIKLSRDRGWS